ncbi:MAG: Ldh family oxidoreductase [Chloroflexi bacterium]|nr:Ldh family oxidoreductase [Chloroflexota bacterium]
MSEEYVRVRGEHLVAFAALAFEKLGLTPDDAREAAEVLIDADLMGLDTHGIAHIYWHPGYAPGLQSGRVKARAEVRVVRETPATALLDGDGGLGLLVARRAMALAIEKTKAVGVGTVAVRNSRHFGASGYYALMAAREGLVGMAMTNASAWVVPTFARKKMLGTNPIAIAAPAAGGPPFVCDVTTSTIAMGKVETAARSGEPLAEGWALDGEGRPTTDPAVVYREGGLTPLGGTAEGSSYKGYGLAVAVDIFCGILSGTGWSLRLDDASSQAGHFFAAFDVAAFGDADQFRQGVGEMLRTLQEAEPAEGAERVLVPGQREFETRADREKNGVPLHPKLLARLDRFADELGIESLTEVAGRASG